jgi:lysyl-tRNA synthetase class I
MLETDRLARKLTICDNMVHYRQLREAAQPHPPLCPKCGSHRTEIVGRSPEPNAVVIRCQACGDRSTVAITSAREPSGTAA